MFLVQRPPAAGLPTWRAVFTDWCAIAALWLRIAVRRGRIALAARIAPNPETPPARHLTLVR